MGFENDNERDPLDVFYSTLLEEVQEELKQESINVSNSSSDSLNFRWPFLDIKNLASVNTPKVNIYDPVDFDFFIKTTPRSLFDKRFESRKVDANKEIQDQNANVTKTSNKFGYIRVPPVTGLSFLGIGNRAKPSFSIFPHSKFLGDYPLSMRFGFDTIERVFERVGLRG